MYTCISRSVSLKPVFVMETAEDWRCRDSAAYRNPTAGPLTYVRSSDGPLRNPWSQARVWPAAVVVTACNHANVPFAHQNHKVQAFAAARQIFRPELGTRPHRRRCQRCDRPRDGEDRLTQMPSGLDHGRPIVSGVRPFVPVTRLDDQVNVPENQSRVVIADQCGSERSFIES